MAKAALYGEQIEIDTFRLHLAFAQRLQVIIFVESDGESQFGHTKFPKLIVLRDHRNLAIHCQCDVLHWRSHVPCHSEERRDEESALYFLGVIKADPSRRSG
jgi:hypothetical protein